MLDFKGQTYHEINLFHNHDVNVTSRSKVMTSIEMINILRSSKNNSIYVFITHIFEYTDI